MFKAEFHIQPARSTADLEAVAQLFEAYAASLEIDLAYQDFASEVSALPGKYASPAGALLLARDINGEALGCIGLRPMAEEGCCEMKRLYVSPKGRGLGLGGALISALLGEAVRIGYREMRLDTLPSMAPAISLYTKAGFVPIAPYYVTPIEGTLFFACSLLAEADRANVLPSVP